MTLLAGLAIRSSVMLLLGLLVSACLTRRSAALRHRVLLGTLVGAVLVVPFSVTLPEWRVTVPAAPLPFELSSAAVVAPQAPPVASAYEAEAPNDRLRSFIIIGWLSGVLFAAATLLAGLMRLRRIAARATRVQDERWLESLRRIARRYGLTREIVIVRTDTPHLLATWGIARPHVLVPRHALGWTPDRVHVVLCHELAHIRRHDWIVQIAAEIVRAILWFNPFAWIVCTHLRRESERACDDEVLAMGVDGPAYATQLLELARQCRRSAFRLTSALPMAHPSTLERRIAAMLNPRVDRQTPSRRILTVLGVVLLLVALPVAALRARQAGPAPLTGTIYDVTGGVMPGVEVTLIDENQITLAATSNASGRFEFPPVGPGKYVLTATLPGFRTLRQDLDLRNARDWDRAVTLQVGDLMETVTIRASRLAGSEPDAQFRPLSPQAIRIGGNIRPPLKIKDVRPVYPPAMQQAGRTGVVPIEAMIGPDGIVSSVRVLSAQVHPDFAIAAVDAVRQWRFTPTLLNGKPVEVVMTVSVRFDLEG